MSTAVALPESVARSPLFTKLPAELRLKIYRYTLYVPDDKGFCVVTKKDGIPEPPLLFTCKAVRQEAVDVFYLQNWFLLMMDSWDPATEVLLTRKTKKMKSDDDVNWRQYTSSPGRWKNLLEWLRLYHAGLAHPLAKRAVKKHEEDDVGDQTPEQWSFRDSLFKIVAAMQDKPWDDVKNIMDGLRHGLIALEREWSVD